MKIAVDLRSLQSGRLSGVENYTLNLLDSLLALDKDNTYTLFHNSFRRGRLADLQFINSRLVESRIPNRLLNFALRLKLANLERLAGSFDWLFMPNLNQFNIRPEAKLAITVHDLSFVVTPEFYDLKRRLWHRLLNFRLALQRAQIIFAVSEYTKLDLLRLFKLDEKKIKVVYPGLDHASSQYPLREEALRSARNRYSLPGDYILFLNTIEPRKNLSGVIKAFERLDNPVDLVVAGRRGWKCRKIFSAIKRSSKSAKIKFIGYVPEEDKASIIAMSKLLVYPSFYEGFGFQPLEAMALGVPAIASNVTSLPEVAGDAALLVDPYSTEEISKAMIALLDDQDLRNRLIKKGFSRVERYGWQRAASEILNHLNNHDS